MPLGLGLGLGIGKGNIYPPASAWPTVADIPPGALVLASDGVVKECRWVFKNAGADFINCGRPAHLIALLDPTVASTICIVAQAAPTSGGYLYALGDATTVQSSLSILPGGLAGGIGGSTFYVTPAIEKSTETLTYTIFTDGSTFAKVSAGGIVSNLWRGVITSPGPLVLGARDGVGTNNIEADTAKVTFYAGYNADGSCAGLTKVDALDFKKWDGSGTVYFDSGHACTVTDGTPFTARAKALVPVSLLT